MAKSTLCLKEDHCTRKCACCCCHVCVVIMAVFNKLHRSLKSYATGLFHDYCNQCALLVGYETLSHSLLREAMEVGHEMY